MTNLPVLRSDWLRWKALAHPTPFEELVTITHKMALNILLVGYQADYAAYQLRKLSEHMQRCADELYANLPWWRRLWIRWLRW